MRIGLNLLFMLPGVVGGTETYASSLINALEKVDNESTYYVFVNRESASFALPSSRQFHRIVCRVRAARRPMRYSWEQLVLPAQVRKQRLDLLHSLGYVQPLRLRCKSVVTLHDLNYCNLGSSMPRTKRIALRYFVTRSAQVADHIITVSGFSKRQITDSLGIRPEKVTVTYNAVKKAPSNKASISEIGRRYGVVQPYILGLSSQSPHKNIEGLVRAFEAIKSRKNGGLKLVLAGHSPGNSGQLDRVIRAAGSCNDIILTGYVSEAVLAGLYSHAEVFVFPSTYEGFGIPVLEAFAHGTPVACSRVAALPEVAGNAAVYFDPLSTHEMASAVSEILSDGPLRQELIRRGSARVESFSWENTARKTLDIYKTILNDNT